MNGRLLEKYIGRNGNGESQSALDESEIDDLGCFGWLRGIKDRSLSVELRQANGNIVAIPYHGIERFDFNPSEGITLAVAGGKILLKGRNLNTEVRPTIRLFEGLARHRIPWIREADGRESQAAAGNATVVDSIQW
ncbi:MAG: hypothetical protein DCC65_02420 [Planctomycetota bacterium]|nr:MAG: hypothetical protein DCC65_02420 [Planctomycetota bacterium]